MYTYVCTHAAHIYPAYTFPEGNQGHWASLASEATSPSRFGPALSGRRAAYRCVCEHLRVCMCVRRSICLSVCLSIHLCIYLSIFTLTRPKWQHYFSTVDHLAAHLVGFPRPGCQSPLHPAEMNKRDREARFGLAVSPCLASTESNRTL